MELNPLEWDKPRNWIGGTKSGAWTFIRSKGEFMEVFDNLVVVAFIAILWLGYTSTQYLGLVIVSVAILLYYWMAFQGELLNKTKLWTSAVIDYGSSKEMSAYLVIGVALVAVNLLAMRLFGLTLEQMSFLLPEQGIAFMFINILAIPFILGVERGVFAPYLAEAFGIVPAVIGIGLLNGVFFASTEAVPQLMATSLVEMAYAYVVLWKKATAPPIIASIIIAAILTIL